jgi:hypothetical protein
MVFIHGTTPPQEDTSGLVKALKDDPALARAIVRDPGFKAAVKKLAMMRPYIETYAGDSVIDKAAQGVMDPMVGSLCGEVMTVFRAQSRAQSTIQKMAAQPMPGGPALRAPHRPEPVQNVESDLYAAKAEAASDPVLRAGYRELSQRAALNKSASRSGQVRDNGERLNSLKWIEDLAEGYGGPIRRKDGTWGPNPAYTGAAPPKPVDETRSENLAKGAEYRRKAAAIGDPALRRAYEQLAREAERRA